ncbi:conserved hypothetical protein [Vibrio coralliirubri]|uniref:hypothetical protein n=1 Tax=Vibrio coralliirubri TaxID=1516159 RepID=UPI00063534FB|nr:hypothetical protein [Vibrio coralliirubri]CDT52556.1 conserved hypothetical protein [Vibrio coralliirubri]
MAAKAKTARATGSSTENIKLGTCRVTYDGQDLGLTAGGVEVEVTTSTHETTVDQFGETVVKEILTGRNITVSVPMVETTIENLVTIMPGATLVTDGSDPDKKKVEVGASVGADLLSSAKELVLHPIGLADTDKSEDLTIPLAATPGGMNFAYTLDQERVYQANFKGYPDLSKDGLLFIYGDTTATVTP